MIAPRSLGPYSPVTPARIYRQHLIDTKRFVSLKQKIERTPDAAKLLREELARPGYRVRPMAMGTNTNSQFSLGFRLMVRQPSRVAAPSAPLPLLSGQRLP